MPFKLSSYAVDKRRRFTENGFDLDLTYIKPSIIAMGFPYNIDEVARFLDSHHSNRYKVFKLCPERSYDAEKFHQRVANYKCDDHSVPPFELIKAFCEDVEDWLKADDGNVAVVHCSNGVDRTGVMICSFLLHYRVFDGAKDALQFFAEARTQNAVGVHVPSQCRYIQYYTYLLKNALVYSPRIMFLQTIEFIGIPRTQGGSSNLYFTVKVQNVQVFRSKEYNHINRTDKRAIMTWPQSIAVCGDTTVEFFHQSWLGGKESIFSFTFNTFFVKMHLLLQQHQLSTRHLHERYTKKPVKHELSSSDTNTTSRSNSSFRRFARALTTPPAMKRSLSPNHLTEFADKLAATGVHCRCYTASGTSTRSEFQLLARKQQLSTRQLRKELKTAGRRAGVDITTGFTTMLHKPVISTKFSQENSEAAPLESRDVDGCMERLDHSSSHVTTASTDKDESQVTDPMPPGDKYESVTIILPSSQLDKRIKDKKYFPSNFTVLLTLLAATDECVKIHNDFASVNEFYLPDFDADIEDDE